MIVTGDTKSRQTNDVGRNLLLGNGKKIAKFLMRTFTCRSTFLYARKAPGVTQAKRVPTTYSMGYRTDPYAGLTQFTSGTNADAGLTTFLASDISAFILSLFYINHLIPCSFGCLQSLSRYSVPY
jgi:hypothetical protein